MSSTMRKEMDGVQSEMKDLKTMFRRTMVNVARLTGDVGEIKDYLKTSVATKDDISALNARMDGFSGLLLDSRQRWAVHADTLKQHDDRLTKLENHDS